MLRVVLALVLALLPLAVSAQVLPNGQNPGVTPPIFGNPSAVDGGGSFSPQLFGPQSCSTPAYSFTGATTSGYGFSGANACTTVGGAAIWNVSANLTEQRNSTSAQRHNVMNTYTSATNYEAFSVDWQTTANTAIVGTRTAATGTARPLRLVSQFSSATNAYATLELNTASLPSARLGYLTATGTAVSAADAGTWFQLGVFTSTATSGTVVNTAITPTYNQSSGTAANTDLLINRTQTAVGSGAQYSIQAQIGGTNTFAATAGTTGKGTQLSAAQVTVPTCSSNCGTSPTVVGSDTAMRVTMGASGAPASGWIVTFNGTWAAAPSCHVTPGLAGMAVGKLPIVVATTTTTITVTTNGTAPATSDVYNILCMGVQ